MSPESTVPGVWDPKTLHGQVIEDSGVAGLEAAEAGPVPAGVRRRHLEGVGGAVGEPAHRGRGGRRRAGHRHRRARRRAHERGDRVGGDRRAAARGAPRHRDRARPGGRGGDRGGRGGGRGGGRREDRVDVVVARLVRAGREGRRAAVEVDPVPIGGGRAGQGVERRLGDGVGETVGRDRVVPVGVVVRHDVGGAGGHRHRRREARPAASPRPSRW